ncbi:MAG: thioredoxin [Spirochaetia bacterium]|nr:thioredoxin [Spirochaetia bacterium]
MSLQEVTDNEFDEATKDGVVMVDFWAPWCAPCRMVTPVLDELSQEMGDKMKILKLNVDENPVTAQKFAVTSIPTLIIFKNGELVDRAIGAAPKEHYANLVEKHF